MKVAWHIGPKPTGDGLGWWTVGTRVRDAAVAAGLEIDDAADVRVVAPGSPINYRRGPEAVSVVLTGWESTEMLAGYEERLGRADLVLAISAWNRDHFRAGLPDVPCEHVPLGVDDDVRPVLRRAPAPGEPFRWLWLGARSPRKGLDFLRRAWDEHGWRERADVELYVKRATPTPGGVRRDGNVVVDERHLSRAEIAALYESAHGFVLPSMGEGFGLTLAEALCSGLPALFTPWGAAQEYAEGWPLAYDERLTSPAMRLPHRERVPCAIPRAESIDHQMRAVMADYDASAQRAYEIGQRLRGELTWDRAGRAVVEHLTRHVGDVPTAAVTGEKPRSVAVFFANGAGNWLMTTPALAAIREALPGATLDVVLGVDPAKRGDWHVIEELLRHYEGRLIDRVAVRAQSDRLPRDAYDVTLAHPHGHACPLRDSMRGPQIPRPEWQREHEVLSLLDLARAVGYRGPAPDMVPPIEATWHGHASDYVAIANGAERNPLAQRKRWPDALWRRLAASIRGWYGLRVVQIGGPGEWVGDPDATGDVEDATGRSIAESAEILAGARAVVAVDTFAMHLAASLRVPLVAIFGPTLEAKNAPWTRAPVRIVRSTLPCAPCWGGPRWRTCTQPACMPQVHPGAVFRALRDLLDALALAVRHRAHQDDSPAAAGSEAA